MASRKQRDLDRLIDASGARVYDEESGVWGRGNSDESGWGLSSITNVVKRSVSAPISLARRGISTSMRIAALPRNIVSRGYGMIAPGRGSAPPPAAPPPSAYPDSGYPQQFDQQAYPQGSSPADYYPDQGYPDPNYPDQGY
jgi:hypothetical protein